MRRILLAAALTASLAGPTTAARAITLPGGGLVEPTALIAIIAAEVALLLPAVQKAREVRTSGAITLGARTIDDPFNPEETLVPGGRAAVFAADIVDFDLTFVVPTDGEDGEATVRLTPDTGSFDVINRGLFTDGERLFVDASGLPAGATILQWTIDEFEPDLDVGFPDGRRFGDDTGDLLIAAIFSGSVNLGVALLPDGLQGAPGLVGVGELTPGDTFTLGRFDVAEVPLPLGAPLLLTGLSALWLLRRRAA